MNRLRRWLWLLPGCALLALAVLWGDGGVELGDMAVVVGLALAPAEGEDLALTIEVAYRPQSGSPGESRVFSASGVGLRPALALLEEEVERRLFWSDCALLLLDQELTQGDRGWAILEELYFLPGLPPEVELARTNAEAEDIFQAGFGESEFTSTGIANSLRLQGGKLTPTLGDMLRQGQANDDRPWPEVSLEGETVRAVYEG